MRKKMLVVSAFSIVLYSCKSNQDSSKELGQFETKKTNVFSGFVDGSACSLTVQWSEFGINEVIVEGPKLEKFVLNTPATLKLSFISNAKSISAWMQDSPYATSQQDNGYLPSFVMSRDSHVFTKGMTFNYRADWYLSQISTIGGPATKSMLRQELKLYGTVNPEGGVIDVKSFELKQKVMDKIPLPFGESTLDCAGLMAG